MLSPGQPPPWEARSINRPRLWLGLLVLLAVIAGLTLLTRSRGAAGEPIGLFTSLPIMWNEAGDVGELLKPDQAPHWARAEIASRGPVVALDTLGGAGGPGQLAGLRRLVIAQPRPLSPQENVALDSWVRAGGHLLLMADPALTEESRFAIGDPRRPQAVVLLSPILGRWGLDLRFDDAQPFGERRGDVMGVTIPANLPGHWTTRGQSNCKLWGDGLVVTCAIGKGRLVALADAAVLERDDPDGARSKAFAWLLDSAFVGN